MYMILMKFIVQKNNHQQNNIFELFENSTYCINLKKYYWKATL